MSGVLHGVRVVEVAQWWFVPAAGAVLADWGADVIKIEHPVSGDPQRGLVTSGLVPPTGGVNFMVEQPNRGKRSVGLDLGRPAGRDFLYRLVETADVFLTNFLPAARRRLAIEVDDIRRVNPKINLLADPRFADGPARFAHRAECVCELDTIFATRTLAEWRAALADAEGVWAPMQTVRELADDPQAVANGYLPEVERGHGTRFTLVASPVQFDETAPALRPAPDLGQDTEEVLLALGLSWEEIAAAKEAGAVS